MSQARIEILKMIADGKVSPEEGDRMLRALDEREQTTGSSRPTGFGEAVGQILEEVGETVRSAVDDALGTAQKVFEETRADAENVEIGPGGFDVPAGSRLRVQQAVRVSFGGGSKGGNVILRAAAEGRVTIVRGEAIEVHRTAGDFVFTWAKGNLELEVPPNLAGLDVRCLGGDLEIQRFPGPMTVETAGGELRVQGPRAPFRFRSLGGRIRIADMDLREGAASISSAGGEVSVQVAEGASFTIYVVSRGRDRVSAGHRARDPGKDASPLRVRDRGRRRNSKIDTLGGTVRVRRDPGA